METIARSETDRVFVGTLGTQLHATYTESMNKHVGYSLMNKIIDPDRWKYIYIWSLARYR